MTAITALNVRLGMDASNFSNGVDLARSEVNRVAAIMRQSVPPAEKFKREVELLDKAFNEAGRQSREYANAVDHLAKKHQQGAYALKSSQAAASQAAQSNSALIDSVKGLAAAYLSFQGIKAGIAIASDLEQASIAFEVMTGSAEAGKKTLGDLRQFAASTPLSLAGSQQAAKTLLAFGMSAEKVMPTLRNLGDVSSGNEERFKSLALAFAQTQAAGRLMGQEVLQMVNAGFNPLQEISRTTGRSMVDLKKQMEAGGISADMVAKAFESATGPAGRFHGMMERMGTTAAGAYNQLVSSVQELVAQMGAHLLPILARGAKALESVVRATGSMIGSLDKSQAQVLAVVGAFGATVMIVPKVIGAFAAIRTAIQAMTKAQVVALAFSGPKGWATIAAGAVAAALAVNEVNKAFEKMNAEAEKADKGGEAAKASAAAAGAAAGMTAQVSPLEKEFLKLETSLNEQVKLLNLGEDAYRRQQLYLKGMSIEQVNRIEQLHQEIKLVEERNRREKEAADERKRKIEEMRKAAADAFTRDIGKAVENAKKYFADEAKRQKEIRDAISKGPESIEVGSEGAAGFMADQVNARIGAMTAPERPTPGEEQILKQAAKEFEEIRKQTAEQARQTVALRQLITTVEQHAVKRAR